MLQYSQITVQCHFYYVFLNFLKDLFLIHRCVDYINNHKILNDKQFDLLQKHSTYMVIAHLVDEINTAVEKNETTIGIFLDLSKSLILLTQNTSSQIRTLRISWYSAQIV